MSLKRDNWTNDEVIDILKGYRGIDPDTSDLALDLAIDMFYDFKRNPEDPTEYSCMAYNTEDKHIYHIGTMPPQ